MAFEKYHALCHPYPAKIDIINKYGYDGKQLHHLLRIKYFLDNYICMLGDYKGIKLLYKEILQSELMSSGLRKELKLIKENKVYQLDEAKDVAERTLQSITEKADNACDKLKDENNKETEKLLDSILYEIVKLALKEELEV